MCDSSWAMTPFELDAVQLLEQPGGHGDRRVLGVAAGGERVRGRVVDDVDAGLGQAAGDAQPLDEVVQARYCSGSAGLARLTARAIGVGLPVRGERQGAGDDEGDDRSRPSRSRRGSPTTAPTSDGEEDEGGDEERRSGACWSGSVRTWDAPARTGWRSVRRHGERQNSTVGTVRAASSASKYSRFSNFSALAKNTVGNCWSLLL